MEAFGFNDPAWAGQAVLTTKDAEVVTEDAAF
jgi:hypothetical protein